MKAKNIVAEIAGGPEYDNLVKLWSKLWSLESGNEERLSSEILKIVQALSERIKEEKKSFLCSFGLKSRKPGINIIDFKVSREVQDAKDDFDKELNEQMLVFIQLMNSIPVENLIRESIAI